MILLDKYFASYLERMPIGVPQMVHPEISLRLLDTNWIFIILPETKEAYEISYVQ